MFFGAGNMMRAYGTKRIGQIRGVAEYFPTTGGLWLAGAVAITGAPPFGLFSSELTIMRAGLQPAFAWAVYVMAALLIVIFVGFMNHFRVMYYGSPADPPIARRLSAWCVGPMWAALIAVLVLGLWWPSGVWNYLIAIAHSGVGAPR
jgi:hydrogenase-4 component F